MALACYWPYWSAAAAAVEARRAAPQTVDNDDFTNAEQPRVGLAPAGPTFSPEVAMAANGHAVMTWIQNTGAFTRALYASRNTGSGWSLPAQITLDTQVTQSPIRVAVGAGGNAIATWTEPSGGVRASRYGATTGSWSAAVAVQSSIAPYGALPHVGVDSAAGEAVAV